MCIMPLEIERAYFNENRQQFLEQAKGKYVLIKGRQSYGFFDTADAAYEAGAGAFGVEAFLIQEVLDEDTVYDLPAYSLGLIHASIRS